MAHKIEPKQKQPETKIHVMAICDNKDFPSPVLSFNQQVEFTYTENMKGNTVGMVLSSQTAEAINAPDLTIYFQKKELKKILQFIIDSEN